MRIRSVFIIVDVVFGMDFKSNTVGTVDRKSLRRYRGLFLSKEKHI